MAFPLYEFLNELSKTSGRAKDFRQRVQLYGFSNEWILMCFFKLHALVKEVLQWGQLKGLSPV
jgi:hypothetical protein